MSTAVKRACDACHRRKVKCDGLNPCRNCNTAQLSCTYNAVPQKKGPKGSRAKVISELRETQRQTSLSAKVHNQVMGGSTPEGPPPTTMSLKATPGLLSREQIKASMDFYFEHMYPLVPILNHQRLHQQAMYTDGMDTYCLLSSLVAFTMIQPGHPLPCGDNGFNLGSLPGAHIAATQILLDETIRVRKGLDYLIQPTFNTLCTSYFLYAAYSCLEDHKKAWYYLREGLTLISMCEMDREETYLKFDNVEASRRRRLFWLFFVAERLYALQHGKPLSLEPTMVNLPTSSDDPSDEHGNRLPQFFCLVNVFRAFDIEFTLQWTKIRSSFDAKTLSNLHNQLTQVLPQFTNISDPTQSLMANQQWLKNIDWRIRFQNGTLEPDNQEANTALQYGKDFSQEVESLGSQFSSRTGSSSRDMIGKILNVAFALTDWLLSCPPTRMPFEKGPQDHLNEVLNLVSALRCGHHMFLPNLMAKVHDTMHKLPKPKLLEVPETLSHVLANVDIFDGFGTMGMAQMPEFGVEEKKYVPDINTTVAMNAAMTSMPPDMTSPFSPAMMSPGGMEFPQTLQDFNTPLEMATSPINSGQTPGAGQNMQQQMMQQTPSPRQQHQQQMMQQHLSPQQVVGLNQQLSMAGMPPQSFGLMAGNNTSGMMPQRSTSQQQIQRSNSFAMGVPRTVGDFQALQRVKTEPQHIPQLAPTPQPGGMGGPGAAQMNMAAMGEIDFSNLRG